jgi:hypothetical protein
MAQSEADEEPSEEKEEEAPKKAEKTEKSEKAEKSEKSEKSDGDEEESAGNSTSSSNNSDSDSNSTSLNRYGRYKRAPGREEGDYGFDEPESIEKHPKYKKEMEKILGKTKEMKKRRYGGYGYYGNGGQGYAYRDSASDDLFDEQNSENDPEKEGYYPREEEEEDELFIHDLHREGINGYRGKSYEGYTNGYGRRIYKGQQG